MKDIEQALSGVFKHAAAGNTAVLIFRISLPAHHQEDLCKN